MAKCSNKIVNPKTIRNALHDNGFRSRLARKKPLISEKNRKLRLEFAYPHIDKGTDFRNRVMFTDESKFNIFGSDGRSKVWRKPDAALDPKNILSVLLNMAVVM